MSSFFDNKARAKQAAEASSSKNKTTTTTKEDADSHKPWVEKYRPKTLDDVKSQGHVIQILRRMVQASNLPHLLLYGPPGTGKTSAVLALAKDLYGPELYPSRVLELNASDERGISVIRERVKGFAQQALTNPPLSKEYKQRYPCPPIKWIVLDEADSLSQEAMGALRRTMEIYSKTTRFALLCNYVSRIIDPLASRCSKFRFKALEGGDAKIRLQEILEAEQVPYADGVLEKTLQVADGDLRKALQLLQSGARLVGAGGATATNGHNSKRGRKPKVMDDEDEEMTDVDDVKSKPMITIPIIDEISGVVPESITTRLLKIMQKGNKTNYGTIANEVTEIVANGFSATEVLQSLYSRIIFDDMVAASKKNRLALIFSEMDKRLIDSADEHLTMLNMCLSIAGILAK